MSAFAGFIRFDDEAPVENARRLADSLNGKGLGRAAIHRTGRAAFVFRQRVLTPEDRFERQPSSDPQGRVVSMFDGRLDNRPQLLDELGLQSPPHLPIPDGDIVRAAYERWGEDAVPRLLGDFAWAVWNDGDRRLLLARDHGSTRALFFSRGDGFVAFATGYRPLLALPEIPRDVDELAVADLLMTSPDEDGGTFYKAVSYVRSSERVVISAGAMRRERVWEPTARPLLRLRRDEEYVEAARDVFEQSVAGRLRIAGPVVASVSGGLDSSAVAATIARRLAPGEAYALCVTPAPGAPTPAPAHRYADERPFVTALAALHPNLRVEFLQSAEWRSIERDPRRYFLESGAPTRASSNAAWFLPMIERAAALGATTLLWGTHGNYTFSAEGFERLAVLRGGNSWLTMARELAALRKTLPPGRWRGLARYQALAALPDGVRAALRRRWGRKRTLADRQLFINPDFIESAGLNERNRQNCVDSFDFWKEDGGVALLRYGLLRSRMQMEAKAALRILTGVTEADPFSDRRVIDFCLSLPPEQFQRDGEWRRLARRAFADRLPPEIIANRKRGAQDTDWHARVTPHRAQLMEEAERLEHSALATRFLDVPEIKRLIENWPDDVHALGDDSSLYRIRLSRALHLGQYLRWIEGGNG